MAHTHDLIFEDGRVRKRYVSWDRGEADREWAALQVLAEHAPGLAAVPVRRTEEEGRPVVVMSRLPGVPVTEALDEQQANALTHALERLFTVSVPADMPSRISDPAALPRQIADQLSCTGDLDECVDPALVTEAVSRAVAWLGNARSPFGCDPVLGMGDGNLANFLWDGEAIRLVDFEDSGRSDLTFEVADLVEHASSRLDGLLDVESLVASLALTATQLERLEHQRRLFACFWLSMLLPGGRGFHRNPPGSAELQAAHVLDLIS